MNANLSNRRKESPNTYVIVSAVILQDGEIIDTILHSLESSLEGTGKTAALTMMYGIQTFMNLFIPSATVKAAMTMPIMAPFSDLIGLSSSATASRI